MDDSYYISDFEFNCNYYTEQEFNNVLNKINISKCISIIHINARSLIKNYDNIENYLNILSHTFSIIIIISESWLKECHIGNYNIQNYTSVNTIRKNKRGGGVSIYIDDSLEFKIIDNLSNTMDNFLDILTIKICSNNSKDIILSGIYRSPTTEISKFTDYIINNFNKYFNKYDILITGDFNINILKVIKDNNLNYFLDTFKSIGLEPLISKASRFGKYSNTLIDNCFTNINIKPDLAGLLVTDISDHLPIFIIYNNYFRKNNPINKKKLTYMSRKLNDTNVYNLNNKLSSYNWNEIFEDENPDTAFNSFINIFKSLYDNCCPYTSTKIPNNKIKNKPWISFSIQKCISKKNVLYKKFKLQNSTDIKNRYIKYKNILTKIIRYSKKKYFEEKIDNNDSKNKWKVVNKLLNPNNNANIKCPFNNNSPIEYKQTANSFNDYFCNIGRKLADNINIRNSNNIYNFPSKLVNNNTFFFYPTNKTEIINIVENSKNKKSNDLFHINMDILKKTIYVISPILEYLFNLSISKGKFPNIL